MSCLLYDSLFGGICYFIWTCWNFVKGYIDNHADGNDHKDECDDQEKAERCPPTVMLCPGDQSLQSSEIDARSSDDGSEDEHIDEIITDAPYSSVDGQAFEVLVYSRKCTLYLEISNYLAAKLCPGDQSLQSSEIDARSTDDGAEDEHIDERITDVPYSSVDGQAFEVLVYSWKYTLYLENSNCLAARVADNPSPISPVAFDNRLTTTTECLVKHVEWESEKKNSRDEGKSKGTVLLEGYDAMQEELLQNLSRCGNWEVAESSVWMERMRTKLKEFLENRDSCEGREMDEIPTSVRMEGIRAMEIEFLQILDRCGSLEIQISLIGETELCPGDQSLQSSEINTRPSDDGSDDAHIEERITDDPDNSEDCQAFEDLQYCLKYDLYMEISNCLPAEVADNPSPISPIAFDIRLTTSTESLVKHVEGESEKKNSRDERNSKDNVLLEGYDAMLEGLLQNLSRCSNWEVAESSVWMERMRTKLKEFLENRDRCEGWEMDEIPTSVRMEGIRAMEIEFLQILDRCGSLEIQTSLNGETERSPDRECSKDEHHTSPNYVEVSEAKLLPDPVRRIEDDSQRPHSMEEDDVKEKGIKDILANEKAESKEALADPLKPTKHKDASIDSNRLREDEEKDHTNMDYSKLKVVCFATSSSFFSILH